MERSERCQECGRLEGHYQDAIKQIAIVVTTRFGSLRGKVRELRRWQEERDRAVERFYKHKNAAHPVTEHR